MAASEQKPEAGDEEQSDPKGKAATDPSTSCKGLTFHEKKEFAGMEVRILAAEEAVDTLQAELNDPDVAGDHERLHATYEAHREAQTQLDQLFARWQELERKHLGE